MNSNIGKTEHVQAEASLHKRTGGKGRVLGAILPAAAITAGLFVTMQALVNVDEVEFAEVTPRPLGIITPQKIVADAVRTERVPVRKITVAAPPPPPAQYKVGKEDFVLVPVKIAEVRPSLDKYGAIEISLPGSIDIDRKAVPIRQPTPSFPDRMAQKGISGSCEVSFDLTVRGMPFNVSAICTDSGFEREAVRAVSKAEFAPKVHEGKAMEAYGLVYPLEFRLQ